MKPNDKAIEAARAAILKAMAEINCIIAGVPFNENNYDEFDVGEAVEHAKVALDAAYAAQFPPSEDYAEEIKWLRDKAESLSEIYPPEAQAADALEAVLAERDDFAEQLALRSESGMAKDLQEFLRKFREDDSAAIRMFSQYRDLEIEMDTWKNLWEKANAHMKLVEAERDALKAELDKAQEIARVQSESIGGYIKTIENRDSERDTLKAELAEAKDLSWFWEIVDAAGLNNVASCEKDALRELVKYAAERDALLARLAPVDDKELVEKAAQIVASHCGFVWGSSGWDRSEMLEGTRAAIAAIRPHIEAAERERCARIALEGTPLPRWVDDDENEKTCQAAYDFAEAIAAAIRSGK